MRGKGILIGDDYDLKIAPVRGADGRITGGLQVGNTLYQNQALILIFRPGELKLAPLVGVGIEDIVLDQDYLGWRQRIRLQMEMDKQKITKVSFLQNQELKIDGGYTDN